jgi:uncharacterized protein
MYTTKSPHTALAIATIVEVAKKGNIEAIKSGEIPTELKEPSACFVSIHLKDGSLRGCIGTIEPKEKCLFNEIISNAISASTRDSRFSPVKVSELESLTVSVDVLGKPYLIKDLEELDPSKLGVIVSDGSFMRGVLLPNIEGIDTIEKQLNIAKRKAGLTNFDNETLKIYAFTSTRYH